MTRTGRYIVIEGHDGTGKTTQVELIRQKLSDSGIDSIRFEEPAGTPISDAIRTIIKNGDLKRDATSNLLLFSAARHAIWFEKALTALKKGKWVIASRNYYSTLAYQGYGEGLALDLIEDLTRMATDEQYMNPDLAVILDLDDEKERKKRIGSRGQLKNPDTFESKAASFQTRVREAYLEIASTRQIQVISAAQSPEAIADEIWNCMLESFDELSDSDTEQEASDFTLAPETA